MSYLARLAARDSTSRSIKVQQLKNLLKGSESEECTSLPDPPSDSDNDHDDGNDDDDDNDDCARGIKLEDYKDDIQSVDSASEHDGTKDKCQLVVAMNTLNKWSAKIPAYTEHLKALREEKVKKAAKAIKETKGTQETEKSKDSARQTKHLFQQFGQCS